MGLFAKIAKGVVKVSRRRIGTAIPAGKNAGWHTVLWVDGEPYPTRHYVHYDRGDGPLWDLPAETLHQMRAIHEAAHAVAALDGGAHLHYAQIQAPSGSEGDTDGATGACGHSTGEDAAAYTGAGERATDRWLRETGLWTPARAMCAEVAARHDRAGFLSLNPHFGFGDRGAADYRLVHDLADRMIDRRWGAVTAVGAVLARQLRLEGDDIADLVRIPNGACACRAGS
ncbi:hypothetical protein [Streptomyces sp. NEAU-174]|uniref:hypothetical protein n=1 Tax=Streptomyces sp. NEAU-174 TaxID=3458254 RepID=UPI0040450C55